MALLVASHYKNTPNDLLLLADAPAHQLYVLLGPVDETQNALPDVLAVVQVSSTVGHGAAQPGCCNEENAREEFRLVAKSWCHMHAQQQLRGLRCDAMSAQPVV